MMYKFRFAVKKVMPEWASMFCEHANPLDVHGQTWVSLVAALAVFLAVALTALTLVVLVALGFFLYSLGVWAALGVGVVLFWVGIFLLMGHKTKKMEAWEVIRDGAKQV